MSYKHRLATIRQQRGAATLVVTGVLLFIITVVSVITAQTVVVENQVTANQQREMQAFNAAQAGLDYFMLLLARDEIDPETGLWDAAAVPDQFVDEAFVRWTVGGTCVVDSTDPTPQFLLAPQAVAGLPGFYDVTSTGFSDDCIGRRMVSQRVIRGASSGSDPETVPLVAGGGVAGGGAAHTLANPENNFTIWSGGIHDPANSNTLISNPADPCPYADQTQLIEDCLPTGSGPGQLIRDNSLSVIAEDRNLRLLRDDVNPFTMETEPDAFFRNFLGRSPEDYKSRGLASRLTVDEAGDAITAVELNGGSYWVDGTLDITGGTVGCTEEVLPNRECGREIHEGEEQPSLVIIDGDFVARGNLVIYGLVYVRGDLDVRGTPRVYGSIIVEGAVKGTGNVDVFFSSKTLSDIERVNVDIPTVVPGTWRDWGPGA